MRAPTIGRPRGTLRVFALVWAVGLTAAGALAGLAATGATAPDPGAAAAPPKMVLPEPVKSLGRLAPGELVDVEFELRNSGGAPLLVIDVQPTCGCTVADFPCQVAGGDSGWVTLTVDTTGFEGPVRKTALILANDPVTPTGEVVVEAFVRPVIEVLSRPQLRFDVAKGQGATALLTVVSEPGEVFSITALESSLPFVNARIRPLDVDERVAGRGEDQFEVTVRLDETAPVGRLNGAIVLTTDNRRAELVKVQVLGAVRAPATQL